MTKIQIERDKLIHHIWYDIHIHFPIDYMYFSSEEQLQKIREILENISTYSLKNQWDTELLNSTLIDKNKLRFFLQYEVIDSYWGITNQLQNIWVEESPYLLDDILTNEEEGHSEEKIGRLLDVGKALNTENKLLLEENQGITVCTEKHRRSRNAEKYQNLPVLWQATWERIQNILKSRDSEHEFQKKELLKLKAFRAQHPPKQEIKKHPLLEYLFLISMISKRRRYILTGNRGNRSKIVDLSHLEGTLETGDYIFEGSMLSSLLTTPFNLNLELNIRETYPNLFEEYQEPEINNLEAFINELKEALKDAHKATATIQIKEETIQSSTIQTKHSNLNHRQKINDSITNGDIAYEKYKGKKVAILARRKKNY